jgi:hypothetical protein
MIEHGSKAPHPLPFLLPLKREWLTADLHLSLIPQGFSPLGQCHPRHSRFESKNPCETKP